MENNTGYIHINEAVKVYGKTRQTFYNYINKELIETQKVNNKLYLKIKDIDRLLSPYIKPEGEEDEVIAVQSKQNNIDIELLEQNTYSIQESIDKLQRTIDSQKNQMDNSFIIEIKNLLYDHQQQLQQAQITTLQQLSNQFNSGNSSNSHAYLTTKKYQFYLGYLGFVTINIIIFGIIF